MIVHNYANPWNTLLENTVSCIIPVWKCRHFFLKINFYVRQGIYY